MENNKKHILIVDDDNRIRELLKEYLNENKYIVSTAIDSINAKKQIERLISENIYLKNQTQSILKMIQKNTEE